MERTGHCALPVESYVHSLPGSERSSVNARPSLSSSVVVQGCLPRLVPLPDLQHDHSRQSEVRLPKLTVHWPGATLRNGPREPEPTHRLCPSTDNYSGKI